jgi:hypothetical protein
MRRLLKTFAVVVAVLLTACTGKQGPTGPQGDKGSGDRVVYTSLEEIPTELLYTVNVPEIDTDNMPLVSIYLSVPGDDFWFEIPIYIKGGPDAGTCAFIKKGMVLFYEAKGFLYQIVVVT